jgi:membrane associated rhomboid family serine protease
VLFVTLIALTVLNAIIKPDFTALGPFYQTGNGAPYLSLVIGESFIYPWTFATASFVEQNVFGLAVTGATLFFGGRYLERAYGQSEFAKFVLFSTVLPNFISFGLYIFFYALTHNGEAL